jgi:acyl-CoA synthetase (AMP-forming)/AMP-acid ligase II
MWRYLLTHGISRVAEKQPKHEAVRFSGQSLSYGELERRSNSLAHVLYESGVRRGDRVGIHMNKGLESAIAMYGIMKAGGAYVPLDPFAPVGRVGYVIGDCGIRVVIAKDNKAANLAEILAGETPLRTVIGVEPTIDLPAETISWEEVYSAPNTPFQPTSPSRTLPTSCIHPVRPACQKGSCTLTAAA